MAVILFLGSPNSGVAVTKILLLQGIARAYSGVFPFLSSKVAESQIHLN